MILLSDGLLAIFSLSVSSEVAEFVLSEAIMAIRL